jgi:type III secretion protein F
MPGFGTIGSFGSTSTSTVTMDSINNTMTAGLNAAEASIQTLMSAAGTNASTTDLLQLQVDVQKWTLISSIQSTVVKDLGDALKGIIQKAS